MFLEIFKNLISNMKINKIMYNKYQQKLCDKFIIYMSNYLKFILWFRKMYLVTTYSESVLNYFAIIFSKYRKLKNMM